MDSRSGSPAPSARAPHLRRPPWRWMVPTTAALGLTVFGGARALGQAPPSSSSAPAVAPSSAEAGDGEPLDVVVIAPRRTEERLRDSPIAVDVIDRREIETSGARDAAGVLVTQAGIQIDRTFAGDGLLMQGLEPQHTLIVIDGERLVGARDGVLDLSRIYAADIQQIEIVRGPASAVYGSDAMAGVVNIVTRPPDAALGVSAQGRYGATRGPTSFFRDMPQQGDAWISATAGSDQLRSRLSFGYRRVASFDLAPETPATTGPQRDTYAGNARLDWLPSARFHAPLFVRVARRDLRAVDESTAGVAVFDRTQRSDDLTVTTSPSLTLRRGGAVQFSGSYARQRAQYVRDQRRDDDGDQVEDSREQLGTLRAQAHTHIVSALLATGGVELLGQQYRSPRLRDTGRRGRVSPFAELSWTISERLHASLLPSIRIDVDSQYGANVSPRLALRIDPIERLILRAAIGRGFRAPTFAELLLDFQNSAASYRVQGNPDLDPESAIGASVSAELEAAKWLSVFVNLYHNELWDLIDTGLVEVSGGEQIFRYLNRARARTQGVEAIVEVRFSGIFRAKLTYALTVATDLEQDRPLPGRARHRGAAQLIAGGGAAPWTLSTRGQVVGSRSFTANMQTGEIGSDDSAPPYATLDARAAYRVIDPLELFLVAENLTDVQPVNAPLTPLTLYLGLNVAY